MEFDSNKKEILAIVNDIKKYVLELKSQLLPFLSVQKHTTEPKSPLKKNDLVIILFYVALHTLIFFADFLDIFSQIVYLQNLNSMWGNFSNCYLLLLFIILYASKNFNPL